MSYHVIDISETGCRLSCKNRQLVCQHEQGNVDSIPMEDVAAVLVNSFSCTIHNSVLSAAAAARVPFIVCEKFKPVSITLPVQRATDTLITRAQVTASPKLLALLWKKTVDAKCLNQVALAEVIAPSHHLLGALRRAADSATIRKEGIAARHYFDVFSGALALEHFTRNRDGFGLNALFNYSYAVLLIRVLQLLLTTGLDPLYGIGHFIRERATPLAYDLMEPFRILFDASLFEWCAGLNAHGGELAVDVPYKRHIHETMNRLVLYENCEMTASEALAAVLKSFRMALQERSPKPYHPWTLRNLKWDGSSFALTSRS